jgi:hypothetical protein
MQVRPIDLPWIGDMLMSLGGEPVTGLHRKKDMRGRGGKSIF